jgi:uncharacterized repeat protein (TIGR03803 family)
MKKQTIITSVRFGAILIAVLYCISSISALAADQASFHVITYFEKLGPPAGLVEASSGVFYSTGSLSPYPVFSLSLQGPETVLAAFPSSRFAGAGLVLGDNGRLYSTVVNTSKQTSVFSVASVAGSKKVYPVQPVSPVFTQNLPDGALLGVASGALGTFYLVTADRNGNVTTFYQFPAGETPLLIAVYASDGNCYGVSVLPDGSAYVYRATLSGSVTKIYNFASQSFDWSAASSLIQASDGDLYGTTSKGGSGYGSIYKLTLDGQYTPLHSLRPSSLSQAPAALIEASDGNLYGTTIGGSSQLFRITKSGNFTVLRTLNLYTEGECDCWLIQGSDGNIYGAATLGGLHGLGDFFSLDAGLPKPKPSAQNFHPAAGSAGTNVRIWGTNLLAASVQFNGTPATVVSNSGSNYVWATVPEGATTGPITVTTPGGTVTTTADFTVQ